LVLPVGEGSRESLIECFTYYEDCRAKGSRSFDTCEQRRDRCLMDRGAVEEPTGAAGPVRAMP